MKHKFLESTHDVIRTVHSEWTLNGGDDLRQTTLVELDLKGINIDWSKFQIDASTLFIACEMEPEQETLLRQRKACLLSAPGHLPYQPLRRSLYSCSELMEGYSREKDESYDLKIYEHFRKWRSRPNLQESLYQRLHDFSMDEGLQRLLEFKADGLPAKKCVGFMGGHSVGRDDEFYQLSVRTAKFLTEAGYMVVSGGGPGIMEAANLGAYLAGRSEEELQWVFDRLVQSPKYTDQGYHEAALDVLERFPEGHESLAIPTWFYGHEPSNLFASFIAKYFSNSIREDTLLAISLYGIVYAPGSAGTTQEIFQEAAQNHYVTFDYVSPMVFLGCKRYEIDTLIYPLLRQLAHGKKYFDYLHVTDSPKAVVEFIKGHPPVKG